MFEPKETWMQAVEFRVRKIYIDTSLIGMERQDRLRVLSPEIPILNNKRISLAGQDYA
jgi:hypothetical protein